MEHETDRIRRWSVFLAAMALASADVAAAGERALPFREAWGWAIVVPVGAGPGAHEFLLDTASESTLVDPALAAELRLVPHARTRLVTAAGSREVAVARADLALAGHALAGVEVLVADLPTIHSDEPGVRGILGQSALARLDYTIDHARRRLVIHRVAEIDRAGSSEPEGRPTVLARFGCGREASRLVVDSGVAEPILFKADSPALTPDPRASFAVATNAGDATWPLAHLSSLCVAGHRAEALRVVLRPSSLPARGEDGLLPSRLFARVRVGFGGEVVALEHW